MLYNDKTAKLLNREKRYPNGANSPTEVYTYECPCKKGTIEYTTVPGFGDCYAMIHCEACKSQYDIETGCGYRWALKEKKF